MENYIWINFLLAVGVIGIIAYIKFMSKPKKREVDKLMDHIINSDKYKVKGKYE